MNCSPFDVRDYFLQELPESEQRQVEVHVKSCQGCREELEQLRATEASLMCLRDEEIPQRIAFVSDKIFEPSPARRWWSSFWGSTARLGFASAAMLSTAIVVYALRPGPVPMTVAGAPTPAAVVQTVSDSDIQARIDQAVAKAVAAVETRQEVQNVALLKKMESVQREMIIASGELEYSQRKIMASNRMQFGGPHEESPVSQQEVK
jgi:anti-sigma factor RsiW